MARNVKNSRRPDPRPAAAGSGPRRLGAQNKRPQLSPSAQRRYQRRHNSQSRRIGWFSVGAVVLVIVALLVIKLTSGSSPPASGSSAVSSGDKPALAAAALVTPVTTVPVSTYNSVGIADQPVPFTVTKGQPPLTSGGKPQFLYYGAEFCPYCASMRWSIVAALSRFGTFTGLKQISSSSTDSPSSVPTFSFLGATYSSPYVSFTPYEYLDINRNPLQSVPASVNSLYARYDGSASGAAATPFNPGGSAGIPFLDIGNKYVSSGDPAVLANISTVLSGGGPGAIQVANALHDPTSAVGQAIGAKYFVSEANYISAAICGANGNKPASVCNSTGVKAAMKALAKSKPVS